MQSVLLQKFLAAQRLVNLRLQKRLVPLSAKLLPSSQRVNVTLPNFVRRYTAKPKKLALVAAMHKLLTILNALIKNPSGGGDLITLARSARARSAALAPGSRGSSSSAGGGGSSRGGAVCRRGHVCGADWPGGGSRGL